MIVNVLTVEAPVGLGEAVGEDVGDTVEVVEDKGLADTEATGDGVGVTSET